MTSNDVLEKFRTLPPEAQKQVLDFIAFLETRYRPVRRKETVGVRLSQEGFVGIWRDRTDLRDSSGWVRSMRGTEWGNAK